MERSTPFCLVLVTTASETEAKAIAHSLVTQKLAACVNILPIQSIYTWDGSVHQDPEWQLLIKTTTDCWSELEQTIKSLHSYDVPEIIALPIENGSSAYLAWLQEMTQG